MNNTILPRSPMLLQNGMEEDLFPFKKFFEIQEFCSLWSRIVRKISLPVFKTIQARQFEGPMDSDSEIQNRNSEVLAPEEINNIDYDRVLVAIVKKKAQMEVTSRLGRSGRCEGAYSFVRIWSGFPESGKKSFHLILTLKTRNSSTG